MANLDHIAHKKSKIEKVPRGIQDEKSRKDTASSVKPVSTKQQISKKIGLEQTG